MEFAFLGMSAGVRGGGTLCFLLLDLGSRACL